MKHTSSKLITLLAITLLLYACGEKKSNSPLGNVKEITFKEAANDYLLASKFNNIRMVQLETTDDCIITGIKEVIRADGKLYVLTDDNELFCFDETSGKFIMQIGNVGEGPGEFLSAESIFYNAKEKTISVVDRTKNAIVVYSLDGEYIGNKYKELPLSWADRAELSQDGYLMVSTELTGGFPRNEYAYLVVHPNEKVSQLDAFAPIKVGNYSTTFATQPMAKCSEGIRFFKYLNDTIFTLKDGKDIPYCKLNLGRKLPEKEIVAKMGENPDESLFSLYSSGTYMMRLDRIYESKDFIVIIPFAYTSTGYYWIDKNKQEGIHLISSGEVNKEIDWFLQGRSIINIAGSDDKGIICSFMETYIEVAKKELSENKNIKVFNSELKSFFEKADPEGNPCLIFYEN